MPQPHNKYVSVVADGNLSLWTGPNPDKDKSAKQQAIDMAEVYRNQGFTAYPVLVEEITAP